MFEPKLDPLDDADNFQALPHLRLQFFMPRLANKPQDPVIDALRLMQNSSLPPVGSSRTLPTGLFADGVALPRLTNLPEDGDDFWVRVLQQDPRSQMRIKSWDTLHASFNQQASSTPFLSEQPSNVLASTRYYVNPRVFDPETCVFQTSEAELLRSMRATLVGTSSKLFHWLQNLEVFALAGSSDSMQVVLSVDDWDEHLIRSYIGRFLTIGTALRRLDLFIGGLREGTSSESPTIHSFAHALASTVDYYRHLLISAFETNSSWRELSSSLWLMHADVECVVTELADMCGRRLDKDPADYVPFSRKPETVLSTIYITLLTHFERHSSRTIKATFAYLLTVTCTNYFDTLGRSVGFERDVPKKGPASEMIGIEELQDEDDAGSVASNDSVSFPDFFSPHVVETIMHARMSLKLLRAAQPDHQIFHDSSQHRDLTWFWTTGDIEAASQGTSLQRSQVQDNTPPCLENHGLGVDDIVDQVRMAFKVFDLEPGSCTTQLSLSAQAHRPVGTFIDAFPDELPPLTPSLPHLVELVMGPLLDHCHAVSSALLALILSPTSHLHLLTHLHLIRDFLLLASPSFKRRLSQALLSDYDDWQFEGNTARALARRPSRPTTPTVSGDTWAVGLGLGLSERTSWPPGGTDLSFFLRTVIMDSLEIVDEDDDGEEVTEEIATRRHIISEAEARLGFSIRDLPTGPGRDKWLDPCCTALDFLLMTYKTKAPLDAVITEEVLSKCQRIFTFTLRIMRGKFTHPLPFRHAVNALYRMTRNNREPLFPTLVPTNRQLLHFRFMAAAFVEAVASYVHDSVIRGTYDSFLLKLSSFSDVFSLSTAHSAVLDDVLSACLLRSSQRAAADLLRGCLEIVLDLSTVCGEVRRARLEEYRAAPMVEELFGRFRRRLAALTRAIKTMVDNGSASTLIPLEFAHLALGAGAQLPAGGVGSLYYLLVKLDVSEWWLKATG
ncbi:Spc98 family-domain-containing protein [Vararia minispora EC-137]|uniref:Spc98 family-domain-containing protein n=1 Tax=Vararia minispora EC-137 TaxID=1314806 RepID=A0ACB8QG36_9AGAM|nr:Spc98 family-domain-containing protein [Vararia minispora EC-137]